MPARRGRPRSRRTGCRTAGPRNCGPAWTNRRSRSVWWPPSPLSRWWSHGAGRGCGCWTCASAAAPSWTRRPSAPPGPRLTGPRPRSRAGTASPARRRHGGWPRRSWPCARCSAGTRSAPTIAPGASAGPSTSPPPASPSMRTTGSRPTPSASPPAMAASASWPATPSGSGTGPRGRAGLRPMTNGLVAGDGGVRSLLGRRQDRDYKRHGRCAPARVDTVETIAGAAVRAVEPGGEL